ncbi:YwmB family TATA-box binding protein [Bacillus shivajii]
MNERATEIVTDFEADYVEQLLEKSFVSLSAYTSFLVNSIETNGQSMKLK